MVLSMIASKWRALHIKTYVWDLSNQAYLGGQH